MKSVCCIILVFGFLIQAKSQELKFSGFLDSYHAWRVEKPNDVMSSRSRFRAEIKRSVKNVSMFVSANSIYNNRIPELTKIELREAFLSFRTKSWDVKAGRQIITWGQADGIPVTDYISPMDLTEFLAQDYDDIRIPVDALRIRYLKNNFSIEGVFVPMHKANIIPSQDNPWGYDFTAPDGITVQLEDDLVPAKTIDNSEYGIKMSFNLTGLDISVLALSTFNKMPEFNMYSSSPGTLTIRPETHSMKLYGINLSKPVWNFILRSDVALYTNKAYAPSVSYMADGIQKSKVLNYLIGLDYYPGSDWNISFQFNHTRILGYTEIFGTNKDTYLGTANISKPVFRNTVTLSTFAYIDLEEGAFFDRTSIDVTVFESIHLLAGFDIFYGEKGVFGQYNKNSEIWIKAKYSF